MSFPDGIFEDFFRLYQIHKDAERKINPADSRVRQVPRRNPDGSVISNEEKPEDAELNPSE